MKPKYYYIVQKIWMAGTPTNPVIEDEEAFSTLIDARRHLKSMLEPRESMSPESYWRNSYRIHRMQFGNSYASHYWEYRVDGAPVPGTYDRQVAPKEERRIRALKLRPGDLVRVRPVELCHASRMTIGGIALVLAPSKWIATGKIYPARDYAYFDLRVVNDHGCLDLMIDQCDEIDSICTPADVPERDAVLRYLSARLKENFDSAMREIRAMDAAKAFVANIAHFDHYNQRMVLPSLP